MPETEALPMSAAIEGVRTICQWLTGVAVVTGGIVFLWGTLEGNGAGQKLGLQALLSGVIIASFPTVFTLMVSNETRDMSLPKFSIGWLDLVALACFLIAAGLFWRGQEARRLLAADQPQT